MRPDTLRLAKCEGEHFTCVITSDVLTHVNIPAGTPLLVCSNVEPEDGDLVIAQTPWGTAVRFLKWGDRKVCLDARNPKFPPLLLPASAVEILGVVCAQLS